MTDPRVRRYAEVLVDYSIGVRPGWQVVVNATPLAAPLVEELVRAIARRGAYALTRVVLRPWGPPVEPAWVEEAPEALVGELPAIERTTIAGMDARITVVAPADVREGSAIPAERLVLLERAFEPLFRRTLSGEIPWVGCQFPCPALAEQAGMTVEAFADALYGAALLDWPALRGRMARLAARFDGVDEVRIRGAGTDVSFSVAGRPAALEDGHINMPGGEVYFSPVEGTAAGEVAFDVPTAYLGHEVRGVRLRFAAGRVVDASAERGEDVLLRVLDSDGGARGLGEFGIGCNPGIAEPTGNPAFDEKILGTVHLAVGRSYSEIGGTNESAVHWDFVKDLRRDGELLLDGEPLRLDAA